MSLPIIHRLNCPCLMATLIRMSPLYPVPEDNSNVYYYFKTDFRIHENFITKNFMSEYSHRNYSIHDGSKVIGYIVGGYVFNLKSYYF